MGNCRVTMRVHRAQGSAPTRTRRVRVPLIRAPPLRVGQWSRADCVSLAPERPIIVIRPGKVPPILDGVIP